MILILTWESLSQPSQDLTQRRLLTTTLIFDASNFTPENVEKQLNCFVVIGKPFQTANITGVRNNSKNFRKLMLFVTLTSVVLKSLLHFFNPVIILAI